MRSCTLRIKKKGNNGFMLLNLNMSKAYDHREWDNWDNTLRIMGFPTQMINLIMQRVQSTSFFTLVNGIPKGPIIHSRGLRQGDPLSPYLFLLCTKGLISLLKKYALDKCLKGVRVCRGAPMINHLLFADNSLIFWKSNLETSQQLLDLLKKYA